MHDTRKCRRLGLVLGLILALAGCNNGPKIEALWSKTDFDPCSATLNVTVFAAPGSRVTIGSHTVLLRQEGTGVIIELRSDEVGTASTLTLTVEKDGRSRTFPTSVPPPPAGIGLRPLSATVKPEFRIERMEGNDLVLSIKACNVRRAESAAGQISIASNGLTWRLPLLAVWDQPIDINSAYALPQVIASGADGKAFTFYPVAFVANVLSAIGGSFPKTPLAAAPSYRRGGPILAVGDTVEVVHRPASGLALRHVVGLAVAKEKSVDIEQCTYAKNGTGWDRITRTRERTDVSVVVYEARTGRRLGETTLQGGAPPPCAASLYRWGSLGTATDTGGFRGNRPSITRWLAQF